MFPTTLCTELHSMCQCVRIECRTRALFGINREVHGHLICACECFMLILQWCLPQVSLICFACHELNQVLMKRSLSIGSLRVIAF